MHEKWPTVGAYDEVAIKASNYLMEAAHSFRIYLKNQTTSKKKETKPIQKPNKAIIWVAKEYPRWQHIILTTLKSLNGVCLFPLVL